MIGIAKLKMVVTDRPILTFGGLVALAQGLKIANECVNRNQGDEREAGSMNNKQAVQQLPEGYELKATWDLSEDRKAKVFLSLASLGLFILFWALFNGLLQVVRPDSNNLILGFTVNFTDPLSLFISVLVLIFVTIGMIFLHEAIHGLFFWLITREKPRFGFKVVYAFAGAPGWYITKQPYIIVGIAPLVVITLVGFLLLLFVPSGWILPLLLFMTMNASGASGDIYTVFWLLSKPDNILVNDSGDRVKIYSD